MTKLVILIPCLNERDALPATLADLPRVIDGVDVIEVLVVDDGSSDDTAEVARRAGAHHVVRFPKNRGLAAAHTAGLDVALRLGADIVVNTDADNQYPGSAIPDLVRPILEGRADLVVGDRQTRTIRHFSPTKKALQGLGSAVVRRVSKTTVADSTSGFRAMSRTTLLRMFVHNRFTYTLESLIQAGNAGLSVVNVPVRTNPKVRESRLFRSIPEYVRRNGTVIVRAFYMYSPVRVLGTLAAVLFAVGATLCLRFLVLFLQNPGYSGHNQSLTVGVGSVVLSFLVTLMALMSELLATNRRLLEDIVVRTRRLEAAAAQDPRLAPVLLHGVESTGEPGWTPAGPVSGPLPTVDGTPSLGEVQKAAGDDIVPATSAASNVRIVSSR